MGLFSSMKMSSLIKICVAAIVLLGVYSPSAMTSHISEYPSPNVEASISQRLSLLRLVAISHAGYASSTHVNVKRQCNYSKILKITEYAFGRSGNWLIELTHMFWLADKLNGTVEVPKYMNNMVRNFDFTLLHQLFCFYEEGESQVTTANTPPSTAAEIVGIESEDSFFAFNILQKDQYSKYLPERLRHGTQEGKLYYNATVEEISRYYVSVYCALWSNPNPRLISAAKYFITNHLDSTTSFTAVHKRSLEGGCSALFAQKFKDIKAFNPREVPMTGPEWQGDITKHHPFCEMPAKFVVDIQNMHSRNGSKIFVAFDGMGDISDYRNLPNGQAVFSSRVDGHKEHGSADKVYLDMLVAMQADLFVLNPLSTYSWEIFIIRACLGLQSLPIVEWTDVFMAKLPDSRHPHRLGLWVSHSSIIQACRSMR